jgi:hypothetical protein
MNSLSDYLDEPERKSRLRNMLETDENTLSFYKEWGCDRNVLRGAVPTDSTEQATAIDNQSISSYVVQRAAKFGMTISVYSETEADFIRSITLDTRGN